MPGMSFFQISAENFSLLEKRNLFTQYRMNLVVVPHDFGKSQALNVYKNVQELFFVKPGNFFLQKFEKYIFLFEWFISFFSHWHCASSFWNYSKWHWIFFKITFLKLLEYNGEIGCFEMTIFVNITFDYLISNVQQVIWPVTYLEYEYQI